MTSWAYFAVPAGAIGRPSTEVGGACDGDCDGDGGFFVSVLLLGSPGEVDVRSDDDEDDELSVEEPLVDPLTEPLLPGDELDGETSLPLLGDDAVLPLDPVAPAVELRLPLVDIACAIFKCSRKVGSVFSAKARISASFDSRAVRSYSAMLFS